MERRLAKVEGKPGEPSPLEMFNQHLDSASVHTYQNAQLFQGFVNTPASTTNLRQTFLEEGAVGNKRYNEKLGKHLAAQRRHPVGRALN